MSGDATVTDDDRLRDARARGLPADVCNALNNLGLLHTSHEHWATASACYEEALQIAEVLGDTASRISIAVNFAEHFLAQGLFDRARSVANLAAELSQRTSDSHADGELQKVFGVIARESGELALAEEHLTKAQAIAERRNDLVLLAESTKAKADVHRAQGRNRDALLCLNAAYRTLSPLRARREVADIDARVSRLETDFLDVVRKWSESIESKDHYTQGHCERVADLACALGAHVGLDVQALFWLRIGAMLHDVGKLVISADVLNKPGPLTSAEWELMRQHPRHGVEMLADIDFPVGVRQIVESHHERWNGTGYPSATSGEAIPLAARIVGVADVYDALASERSYKRSLSHQDALDLMRHDVGKQFDPALFAAFEQLSAEKTSRRGGHRSPAMHPRLESAGGGASLDELTGLPLRRAFIDRAREELRSRQTPLSLLVIDVDHFKLVNDTYGHLAGDGVLRGIAAVLRQSVRPSDFIGRYAGDEFVALLPATTPADAMVVAERMRLAVHTLTMSPDSRSAVSATISLGISGAPDDGTSIEELFAAADAALYDSKLRGRDLVVRAGAHDGTAPDALLRAEGFFGREEERRRLTKVLDESMHEGARLVTITGEAGVGKSALARELAADVRMRAGSLVMARCIDTEARAPLAPWTSLLQSIRVLRIVADRTWRELPRLLADAPASVPASVNGSRFALFEEVAEYLRLAAATRPLVIVLDDMQWADETSWDLLEHVVARMGRDRILFCVTLRDEDSGDDIAARRARMSRDERCTDLHLTRMSPEAQREWLQHVLRQPADEGLAAYLFAQSEGNPFFAVQALRALIDERSLRWTNDAWAWTAPTRSHVPVAVNDLLNRRVARLSPDARRILAGAAVIGRAIEVDVAVLAGIGTESEILDAIDEGISGSVLDVSGERGEHHVTFAHALLVEIMRDTLNPGRRTRLNERVAAAMEELRPTSVSALAHHYEKAGVNDKARRYACLAAEHAVSVYAHADAIELLRGAERHTFDMKERARMRLRRAAIAESAGRYRDAEDAHRSTMSELFGGLDAAQRAESRRAIVRMRALQGESVESTRASCRELLAQAEVLGLDSERAALLMALSQSYGRTGETGPAQAMAAECLAIAEGLDDPDLLAEALLRVGTSLLHDRPADAMTHYVRAIEMHLWRDDVLGQIRCQINLGVAHTYLGDLHAADVSYRHALARGREIHTPDFAGLAALNLGALSMKRGRLSDARTELEEAHALFREVNNEPHRIAAIYNLAHLAREEKRYDDASSLYEEARDRAGNVALHEVWVGATAALGLIALDTQNSDRAEAAWRAVSSRLGALGDAWFQGRELVEAFAIRMALLENEVDTAHKRFTDSVDLGATHDAYGAAWLIANCAKAISDRAPAARPGIVGIARDYARRVETMGLPTLTARFAELLADGAAESEDTRVQA